MLVLIIYFFPSGRNRGKENILLTIYFSSPQAEIEAKKGTKIDDPFTRRSTRPTMVTRTKEPEIQSSEMLIRVENERKIKQEENKKKVVSIDVKYLKERLGKGDRIKIYK